MPGRVSAPGRGCPSRETGLTKVKTDEALHPGLRHCAPASANLSGQTFAGRCLYRHCGRAPPGRGVEWFTRLEAALVAPSPLCHPGLCVRCARARIAAATAQPLLSASLGAPQPGAPSRQQARRRGPDTPDVRAARARSFNADFLSCCCPEEAVAATAGPVAEALRSSQRREAGIVAPPERFRVMLATFTFAGAYYNVVDSGQPQAYLTWNARSIALASSIVAWSLTTREAKGRQTACGQGASDSAKKVGHAGTSKPLSRTRRAAPFSAAKQRGPGMSSASPSTIAAARAQSRQDSRKSRLQDVKYSAGA